MTRGRTSRRVAALLLALASLPALAAETPPDAQQLIEKTVSQVLAILRDESQSNAQRRAELEKIAHERFDFQTMARLVLGRDWKRLAPADRSEFVDQFTKYLANDYGKRLDRYHQENVIVEGEEPKPRGDVLVKTKIVGGENDGAMVDYRMRKGDDGNWRIIDVVIEGISLVANFRDQFREVMNQGGPEGLLDRLKEKNAAVDA